MKKGQDVFVSPTNPDLSDIFGGTYFDVEISLKHIFLIFTIPISVIAILIHEISFFVVFPFIFLIKFQNCYTQNKFNNLLMFSIANILTYILIIFFGDF